MVNSTNNTNQNKPEKALTREELRLRTYLKILAIFYFLVALGFLISGVTNLHEFLKPYQVLTNPASIINSVVMTGLFSALCFIGNADVRRFRVSIIVTILGMFITVLTGVSLILWSGNNYDIQTGEEFISIRLLLLYPVILHAVIISILLYFFKKAEKSRYNLSYLSVMQYRALEALADVVIHGENEILKPSEVALNVDRYMTSFRAKSKWITKLVLTGLEIYPLFSFKPPLSYMRKEDRKKFLIRRFDDDIAYRLTPYFIRMITQAMIRMGKQLCFMGYYNDSRTFESVGYIRFSARHDKDERIEKFPIQQRKSLYVETEPLITGDVISSDVVIIGTGAAASVLAKGLIEQGRQVLMIERGEHHDPSEFTEDEIDMVSKLYADGALQLASDFRFQVFQGSCVGGSTVVNNAVCFDTPDDVLTRWNDNEGLNAGLDIGKYKLSMQKVNQMVGVNRVPKMTIDQYLNPGSIKFKEGCRKMGLDQPPNEINSVAANICGCLGCGYCNMGCHYGKKLSMLDTLLPQTQEKFGKKKLRIIAGCEAKKIRTTGDQAASVICEFRNGRKIQVKAKTFVISAGAISSSILLMRSGIAGGRAGKNLSFNVGSQITAFFNEPVNSYDGLQISHYLKIAPSRGYIFETWFNPPMFQSTAMPGWFDQHFNNMRRYNKASCTGVLVGSSSNAEVRIAGITGREIRYTPTKTDFDTLLDGLQLAGEIYLHAGAESVTPNTFRYREFKNLNEMKLMKNYIKDSSDITIGTGHPQGGNIMSNDSKKGVVSPEFKVYGYKNLFVCDASVFPSSIGVNPQITVMSLAEYAVPFIATN